MKDNLLEVRVKGKEVKVPFRRIDNAVILALGKWIRMARVHEEEWTEGQVVNDPASLARRLKEEGLPADVLTFIQKPPDTEPRFPYHFEWDNFAAINIASFKDWWESLPQESRKNVRRSSRRGVVIRTVELDDTLIQGITEIYNETPFRQGKRFPHYGKDFDTVKREVSTMMDRSSFIGAYHGTELIGFIKLVCMGKIAGILHIVSKNAHYDKRPTNALLAQAVEICSKRGISYLLYGRYTYGNKTSSPLIEFKRRNGFSEVRIPRYYVPLTLKGRFIVWLRLYRGLLGLLPSPLVVFLVDMRSKFFERPGERPLIEKAPSDASQTEEPKLHVRENVG